MTSENREVYFTIEAHIGILGTNAKGWTKEYNMVSWSGAPAKHDLRDWNPEHTKCGRGITMTDDEAKELMNLLSARFGE